MEESAELPTDLVLLSFVNPEYINVEEVEYEVMSDSYVTGTGFCGGTTLNLIEFTDESGSGCLRRYNLRMVYEVDETISHQEESAERVRRQETGWRVEDELLSLVSVVTRKRFWINAKTRDEGRPMYEPRAKDIGRLEPRSQESLAGLNKVVDQLAELPPIAQRSVIVAAGFYRQALLTQAQHSETAYVLLVTAIEVLSNYVKKMNPVEAVLGAHILNALDKVESIEAKGVLTKHLHELGGTAAAFRKTIVALTPDAFYHPSPPHERGWVQKGEIDRFAKNVYEARSGLLHEGRPFREGVLEPLHPGEPDFYAGVRVMRGKQKLPKQKKDRLPQFHALERLVHHLILEFIERGGKVDLSSV